jgi:hypothetical protein
MAIYDKNEEKRRSLSLDVLSRSVVDVSIRKAHTSTLTCHTAFSWADLACMVGSL